MADLVRSPVTPTETALLVGREREQATLREAIAAALAGRGSLVLIGGEAGIGKTALAEWLLAEAADQGALVLVGRCYDLSETPPYGPWRDLFAHAPGTAFPAPPPLATVTGGAVAGEVDRAAFFGRLRGCFAAAAARQPLVLLLDDLHWADPASLDLLRFLARDLARLPVLLLALYRTEELTRQSALFPLLPALVREAAARRLDLRLLDDDAVRAWLRARYRLAEQPEARLVAYLRARAEGNPFFTGELLRALEEARLLCASDDGVWALGDLARAGIPPLLRQVLEGRVGRLGEGARALLTVAAVIGQEVPLALWAAVGAVAAGALLDVVERAVAAGLLEADDDGARVRFVHALVRETLYAGLLPARRRDWHRRVAEALEGVQAPASLPPDPDAVAHHYRAAGDRRAGGWLIAAADRALRAHAQPMAAARCEAALAVFQDDPARARARGWLAFHIARLRRFHDPQRGLDHLLAALRLADETGDAALAAYAVAQRGVLHAILGAPRRGIADLEAGVAALGALPPAAAPVPPPADVQTTPAYFRAQLVQGLVGVGRYDETLAVADRMLATPPGEPPTAVRVGPAVYGARGEAHAALGRPDQAVAEFARARAAIGTRWPQSAVGNFGIMEIVWVALPYRADRPAARRALVAELHRALVSAERGMLNDWPPQVNLLPLLLVEGAWAEARSLADTLLALLAARRAGRLERLALGAAGQLAHEQGDAARVCRLLDEALPSGPDTPPGDTEFVPALTLQRLAARRAWEAGDLPTARAWLACHDRWLAWSGAMLGQAEGQLARAACHRAAGEAALAYRHAEAALARATEPRQPLALLAAHRLLGELAVGDGRSVEAQEQLDAALALAEACAAPYERALTLLALAELRLGRHDRDGACAALDEARAILVPLEASPALARAHTLDARLAAAAPPAAADVPDGLSPREVEVLRLLAAGRSAKQIAEALYLSPRTVKRHVANLYLKIDAHGRAEATAYALRHHLT